jgi:hypothetical protein
MDAINFKTSLLFIPIILIVIYFCAGIFFDPALVIYIKPFIIPTFIIYVVNNNYKKLTLNYLLYVIFFYINEFLILFWEDSVQLSRIALVASFFCYLALVILGYNSMKAKKIYTVPKGFSLFILAINCVFLIAILYIIMSVISDSYLNIILIFNAIVAVFLGITAVLYFGKFGDKKAYYYFQDVVLNTFDRVLHLTSFYLIYLFLVNDRKKVENLSIDSQP